MMPSVCMLSHECGLEQVGYVSGNRGTQVVRKTELEFGLYSVGNRDRLKVLEQGTDLAKFSFRSLGWQAESGRSQGSIQVVVGGMQVWGRAPGICQSPSPSSQGLRVTRGPSLDETVTKSPSNLGGPLLSRRGRALLCASVRPFPSRGRRIHPWPCPSLLLWADSSSPQFSRPWLGGDPEQPLWDDITHQPACRVLSHLDTCSQRTPAWAVLGRQRPERQMPERSWESARARGGESSQEGRVSVCPALCPTAFGTASKRCHRLSSVLWNPWRTFSFLPGSQKSVFRTLRPSFQGAGRASAAGAGFFPSLKSCLRFPWLGLK